MTKKQTINDKNSEKLKKIYVNEFNAELNKMAKRALELPVSYTKNAPQVYLGEATQCFIHGFFNASIALSRATLEQILRHRLGVKKDETINLTCLIKLATAQKLLNSDLRSEAKKIQKWGNVYIHDTQRKDSEYKKIKNRSKEVLLSLKKIIEKLYGKQKAKREVEKMIERRNDKNN